jgi:hypothetical protein
VGLAYRCTQASPTKGFGPLGPFGPQSKQGSLSPTGEAALDRPIPASRWRLTGEGGAEEELWTKGNVWVPVGWMGAHHSGLAVVREDNDGWTMATAQTGSVRHAGDTPGGVGEPGDGLRWAAIGEAPQRWELGGVERSWFSPWPGLTHGGRLRRLELEVLGPVAPACGAAALEWHCIARRLSERQRGECGGLVQRTEEKGV